ncbi:hypothetical protein E4P42_11670 [Mycobacterium sp. PS03-16]|uniref:hypothetical protein n=1 Tax=Mycobacterium sp. PS03-16 TaxID=2559611 RepID=UPI001073D4C6|nr:hypothetical protein [Mycobacterium sp. PS03-16]TFV58368.1 hypothetical protein E4P42_11670 [Mycobacterium sp. PS03-16]
MLTVSRILAAVVLAIGAAVGLAHPAQAEQKVLEGFYTYAQPDGTTATWRVYPICVPVVGDLREHLYLPVGCHLSIAVSPSAAPSIDARLANGVWAANTTVREGIKCSDGDYLVVNESYEFNSETMTGTRTTTHPPGCDGQLPASMIKTPFTLTFAKPLDIPLDRYPLICEPGGLRRCF